jgi:hypothetical protein
LARKKCVYLFFRDPDSSSSSPQGSPSVFRESTLTPAEIANQLREKLKPLRRQARRQIIVDDAMTSHNNQNFMAESGGSETGLQHPTEKPVFTLKQMTAICEKMCKVCTFNHTVVNAVYELHLETNYSKYLTISIKIK